MNIRLYAALSALLLLYLPAYGGEAKHMPRQVSLEKACSLALKNNPGIKSVREQVVQQEGVLKEARSRSLPHISGAGRYETFADDRLQSFGEGFSADSSRWNASLDATLTVFSGGRNYQFIKSERARLNATGQSVETMEEELLVSVHAAYYQAWLADQQVDVQKEAVSVYEEQLKVTKNRFEAGVGEKYDVTRAEVALANAKPPLIRSMNDRRRSVDRLQEIIGLPYKEGVNASDVDIQDLGEIKELSAKLKEAIAMALKSRPEIKRTEHEIEAAERKLKLTRREQSPVVDLFAGYGIESDMFGSSTSLEGWSAGVKLNWKIFDGGSRRGKVQQAKSVAKQVRHKGQELNLAIQGEVRKAYYDRQEAASIFEVSEKVIVQAREALELAKNRFKAGNGTQLQVLESQLQLTKAQLEQSMARHDLEMSAIRMKRAMGSRIIKR